MAYSPNLISLGENMSTKEWLLNTSPVAQEGHDALRAAGGALQQVCHEIASESGWWTDSETGEDVRTWPAKFFLLWVGTKIALIHSEASEALEGHRKDLPDDKLPHRSMLSVELADIVIRVFDLAGGLGFELGPIIVEKLQYNCGRKDHTMAHRTSVGGKAY